jgi:hypothetical protein
MPLHAIPLAYKFVLTTAIVAFLNHYSGKLNLPFRLPLDKVEMERIKVAAPEDKTTIVLYSGGIRFSNYSVGFGDGYIYDPQRQPFASHLVITRLESDGMTSFGIPLLHSNEWANDLMERASRMPYTVTTNDLYQLATNYAMALEIDLKNLILKNPLTVEPGVFQSSRGPVPSPLMSVYWGNRLLRDPGINGFAFEISAVSGQLLEMNVGNACGCKGLPLLKLEEFSKLLAITDEEFLKMSDTERTNLLYNFANNYLFPPPPGWTTQVTSPVPTNAATLH